MSSRWDDQGSPSGRKTDAAAAAVAAAAKIAAQFAPPAGSSASGREPSSGAARDGKLVAEAEFQENIEINDQRNRYMLTKGQTQAQIHKDTGASVTTKGTWYPDKTLATKEDPPLYLEINATTQEILNAAISKVQELMAQDMPQLVEDRHQRRLDYESQRPPIRERKKWPEEKIWINLESLRNFNIRSKVVGPGGMFVKYIQAETSTRVQIKGLGSGFIETETGMESNEPMHINIAGPEEDQLKAAKALAEDLLDVVRTEWQKAKEAMGSYGAAGQGGYGGGARGGYGGQQAYGAQGEYGSVYGQQGGYGAGQQWDTSQQGSYAQPPPPPPEDDAPPPPPSDGPAVTASKPALSPEEQQLENYWKVYITWEDSFVAYHNRKPNKEEGGQDVPDKYRK